MRLHATRNNQAPSTLDNEPSISPLDSCRPLPFTASWTPRWSPVVLQRKMPSISLPFFPLRDPFFHNDRGTPTPHVEFRSSLGTLRIFSVQPLPSNRQPLSSFLATHPEIPLVSTLVATLPKTQVLKVLCLPHIQKMTGWGGILLRHLADQSGHGAKGHSPARAACLHKQRRLKATLPLTNQRCARCALVALNY
jgi:hypothetical protein